MSLPKFRQFYFPGLISLIFLPLFIIGYFMCHGTFNKFSALKIIWSNDESISGFLKLKHFDLQTFRKFDDEVLTGNKDIDKAVIAQLEIEVHDLKLTTDTNTAYSITFSSKARYSDIVKVIDICEHCDAKDYGFILYKNKALIWKAADYFPKSVPMIDNGGLYFADSVIPYAPTPYERFVKKLVAFRKNFSSFWPSALAFFLMIVFTIFKSRRYFNLKDFRLIGLKNGQNRDAMHRVSTMVSNEI